MLCICDQVKNGHLREDEPDKGQVMKLLQAEKESFAVASEALATGAPTEAALDHLAPGQ